MVYFGNKIKALRSEQGITQQQLAKKLGLVRATVSAYEQGIKYPSIDVLIKLCSFFNVSSDYLLGLSDNKKLSVSELTDEQINILTSLILELEKYNKLKHDKK
ncbi:MAG: helix-turn-helix transcriptional regulator [Oscillospiraceae bacterium]|nr:helix-turn-helix transcriptional regulator [Oscillospiraceae bacterium]